MYTTTSMFLLFAFVHGLVYLSHGAPASKYMTGCELKVHTQCVINIGSSRTFTDQCQPTELVACLKKYLSDDICVVKDKDTLPTIKNLITSVEKKFRKDPKFCQKKKKFDEFVRHMEDHFTVQGEGIEFTDPRSYEYSGSGDGIPDDTEKDDDEAEDNGGGGENNSGITNTVKMKSDKTVNDSKIDTNDVRKNSNYWKETSRRIMKGKNERKIQLLVYFDDPAQYKRNVKRKKNSVSDSIRKAWKKLLERYQRWYTNSRFNKVR